MLYDFLTAQDTFFSLDFSLFELLLSSFLGFLSALLADRLINWFIEKSQRKYLLRNMENELMGLKKLFEAKSEKNKDNGDNAEYLDENGIYIDPYPVPVWKSACECGLIQCLDNNNDCLFGIMQAYSTIETCSALETECFKLFIGRDPSDEAALTLIMKMTDKSRKTAKKAISTALELLDKYNKKQKREEK